MPQPALSIIIPVYNSPEAIKNITSGILSQSFEDLELILIDDGSTDNTLVVLKDLAKTDGRVLVLTKRNGGPSSARNLGLDKARGQFIQFYDADDNIEPTAIETIVSAITENNSDMLVSGWQIDLQTPSGIVKSYKKISPYKETIKQDVKRRVLRSFGNDGTLYNLWNKLFKSEIIRQHNLRFREDLRFGEDVIFALEYLEFVSEIDIIPDTTYHYQVGSSTSVFSKSSLVPEFREENDMAIIKFAGEDPSLEELALLQWVRWRWLISYWSLVAASKKSFKEKLNLIKAFRPEDITTKDTLGTIGLKKFVLANLTKFASTSSLTSLLLGWSLTFTKKTLLKVKLLFRAS